MGDPKGIVIIGGNASGMSAAMTARKIDRRAEITVLEREGITAYSRCGLPFVIAGKIPKFEDLIIYPLSSYKLMKINFELDTEAVDINEDAKTVEVEDGSGNRRIMEYEGLILATGSLPIIPPVTGHEKRGVYTIQTLDDGKRISQAIKKGAKSATVVGAGLRGLEMAVAFAERGVRTTVVELLPQVLPSVLDRDMAMLVQEVFEGKGVEMILGHGADEILGRDKATGVSVAGRVITADLVLMATGMKPNVELAKRAGVQIGETGAIKTNSRMETNVEGIYAAGDCVESLHLITQRPMLSQLGTVAVRQGGVSGVNAAGGDAQFPGVLGSVVSRLFDIEVGATGLTERHAERAGMETFKGKIMAETRAKYYPGAMTITVKLIFEEESERLIGGQIVGGEGVAQRVNGLSLAIQGQMTASDMSQADTCYSPPLSDYLEPSIQLAAEAALLSR